MIKNAIMLTGGTGSRLLPFTKLISKHLLPVNGKMIIDYPIKTLTDMGIQNLTIVVGSSFSGQILDYIQDGSQFGLNVNYCYQQKPQGIAQAINICKRYVEDDDQFVVILGDNVFTNPIKWNNTNTDAQIVLCEHNELQKFGVASVNQEGKIQYFIEKPKAINYAYNNYAIAGCYLFDQEFFNYFAGMVPSDRGEFEIVDIIKQYHKDNELSYIVQDGLWSDAGTHDSIAFLNNYFYTQGK
jgi:glucose-1-phosphate thymidylyltransferase